MPAGEVLAYIKDNLAQKAGLKLEIKEFTDYVLPNTALQEGSLDANLYQNRPFLDEFNKSKGTDLVPVVDAYLPPMGVYSKKIQDIAKLGDGATVAVPNETTNEGRALKLPRRQGADHAQEGRGHRRVPADVTANPKHLKFKELDPAQLPRSLDDVDAAVINNNYAQDAGLSPTKDAILLESAEGNPYANLLAVKRGNEDDPGSRSSRSCSSPGGQEVHRGEVQGLGPAGRFRLTGRTPRITTHGVHSLTAGGPRGAAGPFDAACWAVQVALNIFQRLRSGA